jgi:hypothetical protein
MKLYKDFFLSSIIIFFLATSACQKGSGGNSEPSLVVVTSPIANGHVEAAAPGPNFPLIVTVTSAMPSGGVKINVIAKPDGGSTPFFNSSITTSTAATTFSIIGSTQGVVEAVTITVTSVSSSSNVWTGSYKYSMK